MASNVLVSGTELSKSYRHRALFTGLTFAVSEGDRIGLIGPNGSGKTTLVRILVGLEEPDSGTVSARKLLRTAYVPQVPVFAPGLSMDEVLLGSASSLPLRDATSTARLIVDKVASRIGLGELSRDVRTLSGGWRKRLAIGAALARDPDVLFLDEPTNHLDIDGIEWLEEFLSGCELAYVVVTHDRYFLEKVTPAIVELNRLYRGGAFRVEGSYSAFLMKREELMQTMQRETESMRARLKLEVAWLRQGAKARSTKSKGRTERAEQLADEVAERKRIQTQDSLSFAFDATGRQTKELMTARDLGMRYESRVLFSNLNLKLGPGTRLGLLGDNGTGKSTLLRILAGELAPTVGEIRRAPNLRCVYFSQERAELDPELSLRRALAPDGDFLIYRGRQMHVSAWASTFLFDTEQLDVKVGMLSGGEQARVQIAQLILQPADVLLLDEPTNDLDIPTLEILEDRLLDFSGALVLVSHDRFLVDRVAEAVVCLDTSGEVAYLADRNQWAERRRMLERERRQDRGETPRKDSRATEIRKRPGLTYLEKREHAGMEERIMDAEATVGALEARLHDPALGSQHEVVAELWTALETAKAEVERLYARWSELESKAAGA
ncbi:MAG: ABC-F family ATP-binding cassette domain-containing protein [Candidatus Schekmanbacteria bacterium]|nr:ABC-F family ATP-binding cassette domain-containing protein [Candidatus Schekmanbacteria bacterium]